MKKINNVLIFFSLSMLTLSSCTKDLELEPVSVLTNASFWKTEDDAQGALYGMYSRFRPQAAANLYLWGEARSEILTEALSGRLFSEFYDNRLDAAMPTATVPGWQGLYTVVHDANLLLRNVPNITFRSEATKNNMLAQSYTMRAFVYFIMVRTWGDVPLVTEPTEEFNAEAIQKERTPKEEVFKLIKQDLDEAIKLFPNNNFATGRNVWSKAAANALKGDVYLWTAKRLNGGTSDFTTALNALNDVQTADVSLLTNYASIFDYNNKGNKEIIMAVRFHELETSPNTISENMYMSATGLLSTIDAPTRTAIGVVGGNPYTQPTALVRSQFSADDQRKNASILEVYTTTTTGVVNYYVSLNYKFKGIVSTGVRRFRDDVILYRYADVLLMKAEAKNALGQDPTPEMNMIRQRAYGTRFNSYAFVNGTKDQNDAAILKERLLELIFEGKRWWDLVRFGKAFEVVPSLRSRVGQDYLLLFPIPVEILSLESKVKQNPGYL